MRDLPAYMAARSAAKPASGGTNYARPSQAKDAKRDYDTRQAEAGLSHHERIMEQVHYLFADFRSWSRNLPPVGVAASELEF